MSINLNDVAVRAANAAVMKKQQELLDARRAQDILRQISQQLAGSTVHRTVLVIRKDKP